MDRPAGPNSALELALFLAVAELEVCVFVLFESAWPCTDPEGIPSTVSGVTDTQQLLALHVLDLTASEHYPHTFLWHRSSNHPQSMLHTT